MFYLGIDPGLQGGICAIDETGKITKYYPVPVVDGWVDFGECQKIAKEFRNYKIGIEKPFILSSQKGNEKIWRNYERLYLAFNPSIEVRPQAWKKRLGIPKGISKKEALEYQLQNICYKKENWFKITKTGKQSVQLDDGKIDSYCIAKYLMYENN